MTKVVIIEAFDAYPFEARPREKHSFAVDQVVGEDKYPADFLSLIVKKGHARPFKEEAAGATEVAPAVKPKR